MRYQWILMLVGVVIAASCAFPTDRAIEPSVHQPKWQDTGTPPNRNS